MKRTQQLLVAFAFITAVIISHSAIAQNNITVNGINSTITSTTGAIGFGSNNLTTTGTINTHMMNVMGNTVMMSGLVNDSVTDILTLTPAGVLSPISNTQLRHMISTPLPWFSGYSINCSGLGYGWTPLSLPPPPYTSSLYNEIEYVPSCTWVGVGTTTPDAPFTVIAPTNGATNALTVGLPISGGGINDVFSIDQYGNTNISGNTVVTGSLSVYTSGGDNSLFFGQDKISGNYALPYGEWGIMYVPANGNLHVGGLNFWKPSVSGHFGNAFLWLSDDGNIGVGTSSPAYSLDVNGIIRGNEVKVCLFGTCDFVFDKDYKLMPLDTLYSYLQQNHHLPEIASANQMKDEGNISLGKMDSQLLQKVEELTLYILQQQKEIDELKKSIEDTKVQAH